MTASLPLPGASDVFGAITPITAHQTSDGRVHLTRIAAVEHDITRIGHHLLKHYTSNITQGLLHHGPALGALYAEREVLLRPTRRRKPAKDAKVFIDPSFEQPRVRAVA